MCEVYVDGEHEVCVVCVLVCMYIHNHITYIYVLYMCGFVVIRCSPSKRSSDVSEKNRQKQWNKLATTLD
jgi:hypothetical protein